MNVTTLSIKTYLICSILLLTLVACGSDSPDFRSSDNQKQDNYDTSTSSHNDDTSSTEPSLQDTENITDTHPSDDTNSTSQDTTPQSVPPIVTITSAPDTTTHQTTASFEFECDQNDCTFECSMSGPFTDCTSPMTYDNLIDTKYTFIVRARAAHADPSPDVEHTWTVDTIPPNVTNLTPPPPYTNQKDVEIPFECNETDCTFECALNEAPFEPCSSPVTYQNLPDKKHTLTVRATDQAQNTGDSAIATWTVDTTPPKVTILTGPKATTYFATATFTFECNEPSCKFECSIDNATTFQNCTSPANYEKLDRKPQTFTVRASDRAQNTALSTPYKWTVTWPKWVQVAVGLEHACGRTDDGTLWCWGSGQAPVLGSRTIRKSPVPIQVESATDWQYIAAGSMASCGIRDGRLYCWGFVLDGVPEPDSVLHRIAGANWKSISVGGSIHYCGIRAPSELWCWGVNRSGQLGIGTTTSEDDPVRVGSSSNWKMVSIGSTHTCATDNTGYGYCWGSNSHGQIAAPSGVTIETRPQRMHYLNIHDSIWAVHDHTFIRFNTNETKSTQAIGNNDYGQLGLGHYDKVAGVPFTSPNLSEVTGGNSFSCGRSGETILCSGQNNFGQLGRGRISVRENTFQSIHAPGVGFTQVDADSHHACAVDTNGNIWCWGGAPEKNTPTKIPWPY